MTWADHGKRPGPKPKRPKGRQPCIFEGCDRPNFGDGLCGSHYMQRRRGVELRPIRPPRPEPGEGLLWCGRCKQFVDESEFGWDPTRDQPKRTCRPCAAADQKSYVGRNREKVNLGRRVKDKGITVERFHELMTSQGGACAICKLTDRPLDIDHCHTEGHVRGLLCGPCNRALGFMDDDPALLEAAAAYLRQRTSEREDVASG